MSLDGVALIFVYFFVKLLLIFEIWLFKIHFTLFRKNEGSKIRDIIYFCKINCFIQQVWLREDLVWFCSEWGLKKTGHKADRKKVPKSFFKENLLKKWSLHWEKNNLSLNLFEFSYFFSFSNFRPPLRGV